MDSDKQLYSQQYRYSKHSHQQKETKGNDPRNIQSHNKTHTRVRFHHMVTNSIRHKHQQTTDKTKITTPHTPNTLHHNNTDYTTDIDTDSNTIDDANIVSSYINNRQHNTVINTIPLPVHHSETTLPLATRRSLAQLRTNKCPLLRSYLNKNRRSQTPITTVCSL